MGKPNPGPDSGCYTAEVIDGINTSFTITEDSFGDYTIQFTNKLRLKYKTTKKLSRWNSYRIKTRPEPKAGFDVKAIGDDLIAFVEFEKLERRKKASANRKREQSQLLVDSLCEQVSMRDNLRCARAINTPDQVKVLISMDLGADDALVLLKLAEASDPAAMKDRS